MDIANDNTDVDDTSFSNRRNIGTRRRNKKRIRKCVRTNLNTSRGNAALLKVFNRSSGALNNTLVRSETMRSNNKALAQALAIGKKEVRDCYSAINKVRQENTYLTEQLYTLQRVAGAQNNEIENEVQMRLDIRVRDIKKILVLAAKQLQDGVHTLGEGLDLCMMSSPRSSTSSVRGRSTFGIIDNEPGASPVTRMAPSSTIFDAANSRSHFIPIKQKTPDVSLPSSDCSPTKVRVSSEFLPVQRETDIQEMSLIAEQSVLIDDDMIMNEANFLVDRLSTVSEGAEIHQENTGQEESSNNVVRSKKTSVRNTVPLREPVKNHVVHEKDTDDHESEDKNKPPSDQNCTSSRLRRETIVLSKGPDTESSRTVNQQVLNSENDIQLVKVAKCAPDTNTDSKSNVTHASRRVTFVKEQLPSVKKPSEKSTAGSKDKKQLGVRNGPFLPVCKASNSKPKGSPSTSVASIDKTKSPKGSFILVPREETANISPELTDKIQPSRFASEDPSKWRLTFFVPGQMPPPGSIPVPEPDVTVDNNPNSTTATEPAAIGKQPLSKALSTLPSVSHLETPVSSQNNFLDEDCTLYFNTDMEMTEPINYNSLLAAMNNRTQTVESSMTKGTASDTQPETSAPKSTELGSDKISICKSDKQLADPPLAESQVSNVGTGRDNDFGFASLNNSETNATSDDRRFEDYEDDIKSTASSIPEITVMPPKNGSKCSSSDVISQPQTVADKHLTNDNLEKAEPAASLSDNPDAGDSYGHCKKMIKDKVKDKNLVDKRKAGETHTKQNKKQILERDDKILASADQVKSKGSKPKTSYRETRNPVSMHESSSSESESVKSTERSDSEQQAVVKAAVELRLPKPGKIIFAASRKKVDGYRDPVPSKIPGKSRSKQKKYPVSKGGHVPASTIASSSSPPSMFDFHDRTPLVTKEKGEKIKSVYDISMNETVVENRPTFEEFKDKVATNKIMEAEEKAGDVENVVDNNSNRRTAGEEQVAKAQKTKQAAKPRTKPRTKSRITDVDKDFAKVEVSKEHKAKDIDDVVAKKNVKKDDSVFKVPEVKPQVKSRARKCSSAEPDILISGSTGSAASEQKHRNAEEAHGTVKPTSSSESDDSNTHATKVCRKAKPKRRVIESDSEDEDEDPDFCPVRTKSKKLAPEKKIVSGKSVHEKQEKSESELNKNSPVKEKSRTKPRTKKTVKQAETKESICITSNDDNVLDSDVAKSKKKLSDDEEITEGHQAELNHSPRPQKSRTKRKMIESASHHDLVDEGTKSEIDCGIPKKKKADVEEIAHAHQTKLAAEPDCDVIVTSQPAGKAKSKSRTKTKKYVQSDTDEDNDTNNDRHSDSPQKKLATTRRKTLRKSSISNVVTEDEIIVPDTPLHVTKRGRRQTKVLHYADSDDEEYAGMNSNKNPVTLTEKLEPDRLQDDCLKQTSEKVQLPNEMISSDDTSGLADQAVKKTSDVFKEKVHGAKASRKSTKLISRKSKGICTEQSDSNIIGQSQMEELHEKLSRIDAATAAPSQPPGRHSSIASVDDKENDAPRISVDGAGEKRSRRGAGCVSYKEPSLIGKMRQADPHANEVCEGTVVNAAQKAKKSKMSMGRKSSKASSTANTPLNSP